MLLLRISIAAFLSTLISSADAVAQSALLTTAPCPVEVIVPKRAVDMTQRLNDNESCLWKALQKLEQDLADLHADIEAQKADKETFFQGVKNQHFATDASLAASTQKVERDISAINNRLDREIVAQKASPSEISTEDSTGAISSLEQKVTGLQARLDDESMKVDQLQAQMRVSPASTQANRSGIEQGGLKIIPQNVFLSQEGKQINAGLDISNMTDGVLLAMVIMPESNFVLQDMVASANVKSSGVVYCQDRAGLCIGLDC